jgi:serine/threonine protein kinase
MQPKLVSIDSSQWADWLNSIAQQPHQHHELAQVGNKIHYLSVKEKEEFKKKGVIVHHLTVNKIIEITQEIWQSPSINLKHKRQMVAGIRYICEQRQAKYKRLCWLVRWFAKLRGVEKQLDAEKESVDKLDKQLRMAPILRQQAMNSGNQGHPQLKLIQDQFSELFKQSESLTAEGRSIWYENFFILEKNLYDLKQKLSNREKSQIQALEQEIAQRNEKMPRIEHLVKVFGKGVIKPTLKETLATLCSSVTVQERERDQTLFQCSELEALALYAKRLIKSKHTQFSLSLVTAIERTWQEIKASKQQEAVTKNLKEYRVIFAPKENEIFIKEGLINKDKGSYKAVFAITPFLSIKKVSERARLVILQPKHAVQDEIDEDEEGPPVEDESSSNQASDKKNIESKKKPVGQFDDEPECPSGGIIEHSSVNNHPVSVDVNNTLSKAKKPIIENSDALPSNENHVSKPNHPKNDKAKDKENNPKMNEDDALYVKEAENCLLYGNLQGVWPTRKVITVDGHVAIIQDIAGYSLKTTSNQEVVAICLADMGIYFRNKLLTKQDQLVYLKMIEAFLVGVENLHKQGVIHRDLKPENILCSENGLAAVSDLQTVCKDKIALQKGKEIQWVSNPEKQGKKGTPLYIAPEMVFYNDTGKWSEIDAAVDIWAIGLMLWEFLSGQPVMKHHVFDRMRKVELGESLMKRIGQLCVNSYVYQTFYSKPKATTSLSHLVWQCTRVHPKERPSIQEVIKCYRAWAEHATKKMNAGMIQSLHECFDDAV